MNLLCFSIFFSLSESRTVWVVGNGPLKKFFSHTNDVGVGARMDLLEELVFWALTALLVLTLILVLLWITKCCKPNSVDGARKEKSTEKESSSSTSTILDFSGKDYNLNLHAKFQPSFDQ